MNYDEIGEDNDFHGFDPFSCGVFIFTLSISSSQMFSPLLNVLIDVCS